MSPSDEKPSKTSEPEGGMNKRWNGASNTSRRNTLRALGVGAFLPYSRWFGIRNREIEYVEIPYVISHGEVILKKEVPKEWLDYENHVDDVISQLREQFRFNSAVKSIGSGLSNNEFGGQRGSNIRVYVSPDQRDDVSLPASVEGVPIEQVDWTEIQYDACNTGTFDPINGGVQLKNTTHSPTWKFTAFGSVFMDDNRYLMTAAHNLDDVCGSSTSYTIYQGNNNLGQPSFRDNAQDIALIPEVGHVNYGDYIEESDLPELNGYVTSTAIDDLKSSGTTVYKMGMRTCLTSGVVTDSGFSHAECNGANSTWVEFNTNTNSGDSGSPHYHKFTYNGQEFAAPIAHHSGRSNGAVGCAAYEINNKHGIEFDVDPNNP